MENMRTSQPSSSSSSSSSSSLFGGLPSAPNINFSLSTSPSSSPGFSFSDSSLSGFSHANSLSGGASSSQQRSGSGTSSLSSPGYSFSNSSLSGFSSFASQTNMGFSSANKYLFGFSGASSSSQQSSGSGSGQPGLCVPNVSEPRPPLPKSVSTSVAGHDSPQETAADSVAVCLKVMVEKNSKRVVFAESNVEFVDLLFSFLTLPIGTILGILKEKSPSTVIGCMNNIYTSVGDLDSRLLSTTACREMLLWPRRSSEAICRNLKLKFKDNLDPVRCFYFCENSDCRREGNIRYSEFPNFYCRCGRVMQQLAIVSEPVGRTTCNEREGVFLKGGADVFMITDDLQVMPGSTSPCILLSKKLGIIDANELVTQSVTVGPEEILQLLSLSLVSKKPLTNWIGYKQCASDLAELELEKKTCTSDNRSETIEAKRISLKLFKSKSRNTVLFAESGEDFVDFLFSLHTFPVGSIINLLDGNSSIGCADNLYRSVEDLSSNNYFKSEELKNMLLCPKLAPFYACKNQILHVEESFHPQYSISHRRESTRIYLNSTESEVSSWLGRFSIINPKYSTGETTSGGGFMKGPAKFMVTDSLIVTQLSPISSISLLAKLNVPITDVDEIVVGVGEEEALNILKAALISETALTDVFFNIKYQRPVG